MSSLPEGPTKYQSWIGAEIRLITHLGPVFGIDCRAEASHRLCGIGLGVHVSFTGGVLKVLYIRMPTAKPMIESDLDLANHV